MSRRFYSVLALLLFGLFFSCTYEKMEIPQPETPPTKSLCDSLSITYSGTISSIIQTNCNGCHVSGYSSGDFTTYNGLKLKVDDGSFENRVLTLKDMPTTGALTPEILQKIRCWLNAGASNN